ASLLRAIANDRDPVAPITELSQFLRRYKRSARKIGFIAERPIQFARMPHTLVDREPQVCRMNYQVLLSRFDRLGFQLAPRFLARFGGLPNQVVFVHIFIPTSARRRQAASSCESS